MVCYQDVAERVTKVIAASENCLTVVSLEHALEKHDISNIYFEENSDLRISDILVVSNQLVV